MALREKIDALLGVSAFARPRVKIGRDIDDPGVRQVRELFGGQLAPPGVSQPRWLPQALEDAQIAADQGSIAEPARLWRAAKTDGVLRGVLETRTGGLVRLPRRFRGDPGKVQALEAGRSSVRSVFDDMCPPAELAAMADDGVGLGVAVGELVPVEGRDFPRLVRLDPEFLVYRWASGGWFYKSTAGLLRIVPGDGRWVLHLPGGLVSPWQSGVWRAVGRAFIAKEHAIQHDSQWQAKLAHPARVAVSPQNASDQEVADWAAALLKWGPNSAFGVRPGWDVKLLESNGRGHEAFKATKEWADREFMIAIAGQVVTTDGGSGFANADIHRSIRADLIKATADSLAHTINTQILPPWVVERWGVEGLDAPAIMEWDVAQPRERAGEAAVLVQLGIAIKGLRDAGISVDAAELCSRFGVPVEGDLDGDGRADTEPAAQVSKVPATAEGAIDG